MKEKIKKYLLLIIIIGGLFIFSYFIFAHPGRTDSAGCHTCRTNCPSWGLSYGEYHCHRAKALPQPEPPIKSHRDGTTEPAPEYETPLPKSESPTQKYNSPSSKQYTADIPKEGNGGFIWWWIIGIGFVVYLFYTFKKNK